jgi:hypothetical protein
MKRLRFAEQVPPLPARDTKRLMGLPGSWEAPIPESAVDALVKRARVAAAAGASAPGGRGADAVRERLKRDVELLERADELHMHASRLETLAQLYRALVSLAGPEGGAIDLGLDESPAWLQTGALPGALGDAGPSHGPAFRATAALRARAFRLVASSLARLTAQSAQRGAR